MNSWRVPKLRDGKAQADPESWTGQSSPALHQAHRTPNHPATRGLTTGNSLWDRAPSNSFLKGMRMCKAGRSQEQPLRSSSTSIRVKATPTTRDCGEAAWYGRVSSYPEAKTSCALTPRLPHHETCLLPGRFHSLPHLEQFCLLLLSPEDQHNKTQASARHEHNINNHRAIRGANPLHSST